MRNRTLLFSLFLVLAALAGQAQTDTLPKALLWRIDAPDAPAPSYLFGTIHLIGAEDFLLSDSLMSALNRTETVTFEIDPADMKNPATAMQLMMKAFMRGDTTLRDLVSEEEYAQVDAHFSELGLPMMFLDRVKPMFLSMLAGMDGMDFSGMMGGEGGAESDIKSYEFEIDAVARASDKTVSGLETVDFQMGLFDSIPYRAQAQMLLEAIDTSNAGNQSNQLEELTKIYVSGDVDGMFAMSVGEDGGVGGFERMLITNRNRNWIEPIKMAVAERPTLFAVGAGHLGGPEGVVRLLRAEGFTLTPLSVR